MPRSAILFVKIFCTLSLLAVMYDPVSAFGQGAIFVDTRLLVAAHPLMRDFDLETHRFRGTSSESIEGGAAALEQLQSEIERLEKKTNSSTVIPPTLAENAPAGARAKSEREYIAQKKGKAGQLLEMQQRLYYATLIPGRPGVTPVNTIFPQIQEILSDVKRVVTGLKNKYKAELVIDISTLYPYPRNDNLKTRLLLQNQHFSFWRGKFDQSDALAWLAEAKDMVANTKDDGSWVVPYGALDVRLESVKLMEETVGRNR